jgi:hypothetical protein
VYGTPAVNYRIFNGKSMNRVINIIGIAGSLLVPSQGAELPRAVDRDGNPPVPIITAHDHCAWPNLKLLKDGRTLAAFIFNNASHAKRPGDIECWLSRDGGGSWKLASAITQHEPETTRHLHASGLAANGDIIVLASGWSNRWPPGKPRTRGSFRYELLGPWLSRSPDGGHSWWVEKNTFPQETPAGRPAVPFGNIERAANGDLCVSVYSPQEPWEKFEERKFRSWLLRSSDDGKSARGLFWSNEKMSPVSRPTTNYAASSAP